MAGVIGAAGNLRRCGEASSTTRQRLLKCLFVIWLGLGSQPGGAIAQSLWEVSPYRVHVAVATDDSTDLSPLGTSPWAERLQQQLASVFGAAWDSSVGIVDQPAGKRVTRGLSEITPDELLPAIDVSAEPLDKLVVVAIDRPAGVWRTRVRQFDCRVWRWGPTATRWSALPLGLLPATLDAAVESFLPLVRIDRVADNQAFVRVRGRALIVDPASPALPRRGMLFQPIERKSDVVGRAGPGQIRDLAWTVLHADGYVGNRLRCEIVSGFHQPFGAKRNRRVEQLALAMRLTAETTTLHLLSRDDPAQPLVGFDLFEKLPPARSGSRLPAGATEGADKAPSATASSGTAGDGFLRLGSTNWRGELAIARIAERPVRLLYVKSGNRVMARLPIVPGALASATATLSDDRVRLEAESLVQGVQTGLVDLVARRESLTQRIRRSIEASRWEQAEALLRELRDLPTRDDFRRRIELGQQSLDLSNEQLRRRIDAMFVDTYKTLGQFLDANQVRQLQAELAAAQAAGRNPGSDH